MRILAHVPTRPSLRYLYPCSLLLGLCAVLGFAPFYMGWILFPCLGLLFWFWQHTHSVKQTTLSGFAFGIGLFGGGTSWIYNSIVNFGGVSPTISILITLVGITYLATYPAMAGALMARWGQRSLMMAALFWCGSEWLRGTLLTGFPWLVIGYSQLNPSTSSNLTFIAPILGVYGVSLGVALCAALFAWALARTNQLKPWLALLGMLGLIFIPTPALHWTNPTHTTLSVSLLQGNIPIERKWSTQGYTDTLHVYQRLYQQALGHLIVLPETALPQTYQQIPPSWLQQLIVHQGKHGDALIGTMVSVGDNIYNSAVLVNSHTRYDKRHLVPFGEFVPPGFRWLVDALKIPMSDFTPGHNTAPILIAANIPILPSICYEDIFGEEIAAQLGNAEILVNLSDVAWFGHSFAAAQQLQMAQMRSLETGRPSLRAGNSGITAIINPQGHITARLPSDIEGILEATVTPYQGSTPFIHYRNQPILLILMGLFIVCYLVKKRQNKYYARARQKALDQYHQRKQY